MLFFPCNYGWHYGISCVLLGKRNPSLARQIINIIDKLLVKLKKIFKSETSEIVRDVEILQNRLAETLSVVAKIQAIPESIDTTEAELSLTK